ncbi:MAG: hypothetical protein ACOCPZ_01970 [Natrialbaceae archaeon]
MGYDKATFGKGLSASILILALIGGLVLSTNTAYAMSVAGVGGFTVEADQITAEDSIIYPGSGETAGEGETSQILIEQRDVEIEGLTLTKEVPTSDLPGIDEDAAIVISSDETVTADEQMLKVSDIQAGETEFGPQVIQESDSSEVEESFDIRQGENAEGELENDTRLADMDSDGPGQHLEDAELQTHYLASSTISIPDMQFDIDLDGGE